MFRPRWKTLLLGAVVAVTVANVPSQADAGWWWGARPFYVGWDCCGYSVGYRSLCDDWGCGWYSRPIRAHRWYGACGWASYCTTCCYDPCCCEPATCCDAPAVVPMGPATVSPLTSVAPTPAPPPPPTKPAPPSTETAPALPNNALPEPAAPGAGAAPAKPRTGDDLFGNPPAPESPLKPSTGGGLFNTDPIPAPPGGTSMGPTAQDSGMLTVYVPAEAKVTINGFRTRSEGSKRQFVSLGLQPGYSYKYEVKASLVRDGQLFEETRTAVLTAGERTAVAFGFNPKGMEGIAAN